MKKLFLCIALAIVTFCANAQESQTAETTDLKPVKGSFSTELNFNPFKGNLSFNNVLNQVKGRYFIDSQLALRLGFNVNTLDSNSNYGNPYGAQASYNSDKRSSTSFGLNIGIEKHFKGTKRLSPYVGLDVTWGTKSAKQESNNGSYATSVKNGWLEIVYYQIGTSLPYYTTTSVVQGAYNRFGITAVAGFDFYMAKNFFLGYEFNLGYSKINYKTPEVKVTGQNVPAPNYYSSNSISKFGTSLVNGIRVGYVF
ncbi:autotransporter domain-containing protein [Pedobacter montanisoli]|uniref:Autotransporter domain-containing protein n=1 Tax=Pedobacter montanisoli TaxID=2923277 RepID=A0ABS9ZWM6_9SPHI|nr:autotransporter domain-containing protein [Pedobacter montanisoli]MCJ0742703.1 autotransporter domain-containing protein [Pedobacter montanisoli]